MENVPKIFKVEMTKKYPPNTNGFLIEEYFHNYFMKNNLQFNRIYLPVFWTSYYLSNKSGREINELKNYIKTLDIKKKYFTIVQHCRGILCDVSNLDIIIFSSGGLGRNYNTTHFKNRGIVKINNNNLGDIPIPLLGNPHLVYNNEPKDILCSFLGDFNNHKDLRKKMYNIFVSKKGYLIDNSIDFNSYYNILCKSKFSLCPRGVGLTSFRLYESLQCLSIPIYIYDDVAWLPYEDIINWSDISIIIHESKMDKIDEIIKSFSEKKILEYQNKIKILINKYFIMEGVCNYIKNRLE
jgi:hypothetical protein